MASEGKHPHEFRRYRQGLLALYFAIVAAGGALLVASVVWQLAVPHAAEQPSDDPEEPPISVEDPDPDELLRCHADLSDLLTRLGTDAGELLAAPPVDGRPEVGTAWNRQTRQWRVDYEAVGDRCRFPELAAARAGAAFERMAEVYADLPAMRSTYQHVLGRFDDHLAGELAQMRRALDRSRDALLRHPAAPAP